MGFTDLFHYGNFEKERGERGRRREREREKEGERE